MILFVFVSSNLVSAATPFAPTTTLAAETGNNTSAAASFAAQSNGNMAGSNVSKVPTRTLLYPGSTAKIYAHFVPWFGFGDHMNVGYNSNDPAQVQKQVTDMVSRGFDGVVIDWYGRGETNPNFVSYDQATQYMMHDAEAHPGFTFAIMEDVGALKVCAQTAGCNVTQTMIDDLNYVNTTYFNSPAYLRFNGRPVVYFFGEEAYNIDWNLARSAVAGNPIFVIRNAGGFNSAQSGGGYSWIEPTIAGMTYLDGFYAAALTFPTEYATGSGYKGFDDSLAAWTAHRQTPQNCGQTWLTSIAEAGKYYSTTKQLFGIQLVTWNDYEEGTEIETGIDNCVTVNASVSGTTVSWSITGQMNTVDHFSVYVSQDGQNLMWLADETTTVSSLNLAQFGLPAGNYVAFVKAVGKPSLTNKMSNGPQVTLAGGGGTPPPVAALSISAPGGSSASVTAGQTASYSLQLAATGGPLSVSVSCAGAPPKGACTAPPTALTVTPGSPLNFSVNVSTTASAGLAHLPDIKNGPPAVWLPVTSVLSMAALFFGGKRQVWVAGRLWMGWAAQFWQRSWIRKMAFVAPLLMFGLGLMTGCGGNTKSQPNAPTPPYNGTPVNTYMLTITATSGNISQSQQLTLTVH
jgi:hypothetical protein